MIVNHYVNWEKTCANISNRLSGLAWEKDFAETLYLNARSLQHRLNGHPLPIEELYAFASLFGCSIEDLIVFEHEDFVEPERFDAPKRTPMELSTVLEIGNMIDNNARHDRSCEIKNLYEFLLYLPLMPQETLHDVVFRCDGNLSSFNRYYLADQMNYLYKTIPDGPAKSYADSYRDNVLRVKGDGERLFSPDEYQECCYSLSRLLYTEQISYEKYQTKISDLKDYFNPTK